MKVAILAALIVLTCAALIVVRALINTPPGDHHKPQGPTWRQRWRDRRQAEQAQDDAYLRAVQEVRAEQHMETGPVTASGMTLPAGPLMPLPPEAERPHCLPGCIRVDSHDGRDEYACMGKGGVTLMPPPPGHVREPYGHDAPGMPDDAYFCASDGEEWPCAAAAEDPHDVASDDDQADALVGDVRPDPEMDYRDETGTWLAVVADVEAEVPQ